MMKKSATATALIDKAWSSRCKAMVSSTGLAERQNLMESAHLGLLEAVVICRAIGAQFELVDTMRKLGHIEQDLGNIEEAQQWYEEAVAEARELNDNMLLAHSVRHLGDIHLSLGNSKDADTCYTEALTLYRNQKPKPALDLANAIRPMAILKEEAGQTEEANKLWQEARDLYADAGIQAGVVECTNHLRQLSRS